jgi:hypothetical protein
MTARFYATGGPSPRWFERISRSNFELAVLTPQTAKLLALHRRQAILAAALVTIGLRNPVADGLRRRLELLRQLLRRATGPYQLDHLPAKFRRVSAVLLRG